MPTTDRVTARPCGSACRPIFESGNDQVEIDMADVDAAVVTTRTIATAESFVADRLVRLFAA